MISKQRKHPECRHEAERSACCLQCNHDLNQREGNRYENHDHQLAEGVELPDEYSNIARRANGM
jgi:hypothetical protein